MIEANPLTGRRPPHPTLRVDLSPEGEVNEGQGRTAIHLSLRGRGRMASAIRVRGPYPARGTLEGVSHG
jgi:hypothetical protein